MPVAGRALYEGSLTKIGSKQQHLVQLDGRSDLSRALDRRCRLLKLALDIG